MDHWEILWEKLAREGRANYMTELLNLLSSKMNLTGKRILEIGGGTGGNASWLASKGAEVYLLDLSPNALKLSRQTADSHNVNLNLLCGDANILPFSDGVFDIIYHVGVLQLFRQPEPLLLEQRRILKEGGYLLVDVPQTYNYFTVRKHVLLMMGRWPYGDWETEYSFGQLTHLLQEFGFQTIDAYGRGYYPRPFYALRHLNKLEEKLPGKVKILPLSWWRKYDSLWENFEESKLGLYSLMDLGVLGKKISDQTVVAPHANGIK